MALESKNYTLGRGKVYFSRFKPGTQTPEGFFYIGNTPAFSLTIESENLDHFSSDEGIREKDDSVPLEVTRSGQLTTDQISPKNVALFFFGEDVTLTQLYVAPATESLVGVKLGHYYQLGISAQNPGGLRGLGVVGVASAGAAPASGTVTLSTAGTDGDTLTIGNRTYTLKNSLAGANQIKIGADATETAANLAKAVNGTGVSGTDYGVGTTPHTQVTASSALGVATFTAIGEGTGGNSLVLSRTGTSMTVSGSGTLSGGTGTGYVAGTDYSVDLENGFLQILEGGSIVENGSVDVTYNVRGSSREQVISGSEPVEGAIKFIANNPAGRDYDYFLPYAKFSPNGDYALKGDEWQQIPFTIEVLKPDVGDAIIMDGRPVYS